MPCQTIDFEGIKHLDRTGAFGMESTLSTPQKSNIDTKNCHILKESTFSKPSFWVSMLVFGNVYHIDLDFV